MCERGPVCAILGSVQEGYLSGQTDYSCKELEGLLKAWRLGEEEGANRNEMVLHRELMV